MQYTKKFLCPELYEKEKLLFELIKMKIVSSKFFKSINNSGFIKTVYENFINLTEDESLNHTEKEIHRLLNSNDFVGIMLLDEQKLIGYTLGEFIKLNDGRHCYYISYIFVSKYYRNNGLASKMLNKILELSIRNGCTNIILTMDTSDTQLLDFYMNRGFALDIILRKYSKHDVLSLDL